MNLNLREGQIEIEIAELGLNYANSDKDKERLNKAVEKGRQTVDKAQRAIDDSVNRKEPALGDTPRHFFQSRFAKLTQDPLFIPKHQDWLKQMRTPANEARFKAGWQKLARFGIAAPDETLTPLLPGKTLADIKWTKFEVAQLEAFHASLLAELAIPGAMHVEYRTNYVDQRVERRREWRDVYLYGPNGESFGWLRFSSEGLHRFNREGFLVVEKDEQTAAASRAARCAMCRINPRTTEST